MKSTGEVLGVGRTLREALYKGLSAAGYSLKKRGGVLFTIRDSDKAEIVLTARKFFDMGFKIYATEGTAKLLNAAGIDTQVAYKIHQNSEYNIVNMLEEGIIDYVISTSSKGRIPTYDNVKIRRKAVELSIPCLTSVDTANAIIDSLNSGYSLYTTEIVDINTMRKK